MSAVWREGVRLSVGGGSVFYPLCRLCRVALCLQGVLTV